MLRASIIQSEHLPQPAKTLIERTVRNGEEFLGSWLGSLVLAEVMRTQGTPPNLRAFDELVNRGAPSAGMIMVEI